MPRKNKPATASTTTAVSARSWWKGVIPAKWGLGYVRHHQAVTPSPAAATTKLKLGAWLATRWKKTAQFRASMRWGSLSYIANKWEEEQLASTGDCNVLHGRAKADPGTCGNSATEVGDASSPASAAFFRRRVVQSLILGAIVAATIYAVYRRSRYKPRRPRPRRQLDGDSNAAATASGEGWWKTGGRRGGSGSDGSVTSDGADEGNSTSGEAGGADGGGADGVIDEDENPELTRVGHGGAGADDGGEKCGDRKEFKGTGACPPKSPESGEPAPTSCPSPEHDRERAESLKTAEGGQSDDQGGQVPPGGKAGEQVGEKMGGGNQQGEIACAGSIGDPTPNGGGRPNESDPVPMISCGPSLLSESSSEELLAEVDDLIDNDSLIVSRAHSFRAKGAAKRASVTGASKSSRSRATSRARKNSDPSNGSSRSNLARDIHPDRPRDTRRPKRARVYREMSGEEIDALVSLTNRALDRDPAALSEIAEDASLQEGGDGGMSIGDLAENASAVWDAGGGDISGVTSLTPTLWSDSSSPNPR